MLAMALLVGRLLLTLQYREAAKAVSVMAAPCRRQDGGMSAALTELRSGDRALPFIGILGTNVTSIFMLPAVKDGVRPSSRV